MVAHPGAGGIGCNLIGANYNLYFNRGFSLDHYLQSKARTDRPGQKKTVIYTNLIARNTIDEHITQKLNEKQEIGESILNFKGVL